MTGTLGVHSEVGQLRQTIVHRPGLELNRLTPGNCQELLFDDVLWAEKARQEHDAFTQILREHGVQVHHFDQLLTDVLSEQQPRAFVLDRLCTPELVGPTLSGPLRQLLQDADAAALAELLIGGVTRGDLSPMRAGSLRFQTLSLEDFVLAPLPNTLFQRDNSAWMYGGVSINPMAKAAGNASPCTAELSTPSTRSSGPRRSRSSTATTTARTSRRPAKAVTSTSWAVASCSSAWESAPPRWPRRSWPGSCSAPDRPRPCWPLSCLGRGRSCTWTPS